MNFATWSDYSLTFWTTAGTLITAIGTLGLVVGAFFAWRTARNTLEQMERDSKAQARPYLHAELSPSIAGAPVWDLVIRNTGRSSARNVRGTLDGYPEGPFDLVVWEVRRELEEGRTIAPTSALRLIWFTGNRRKGETTTESSIGYSDPRTLSLTYSDDQGETFTDSFRLAPVQIAPAPSKGPVSSKADGVEKRMSDLVQAIGSLRLD